MKGNNQKQSNNLAGKSNKVLIPVDFSAKASISIQVGFELARRLSKEVILLHASTLVNPSVIPQFPDDFYGIDNENTEIEEVQIGEELQQIDNHSFQKLETRIRKLQQAGKLPDINFDTVLTPGMPEEVIADYCDEHDPEVIVMATRGCDRRREELIGSVTGEVIDHSFAPVFAIPECYTFHGFKEIVRICAFCYCDDGDYAAIRYLMQMFDDPSVKIYLFPAIEKLSGEAVSEHMDQLKDYLSSRYPKSEFIYNQTSGGSLREKAETFFTNEKIQMILAPNRKRNALARFFNPGLAHRILFEIDFPLFAIPV